MFLVLPIECISQNHIIQHSVMLAFSFTHVARLQFKNGKNHPERPHIDEIRAN